MEKKERKKSGSLGGPKWQKTLHVQTPVKPSEVT